MAGRAWLWCAVVAAGLAHGAEREYAFGGPSPGAVVPPPPPPFAAGSVLGPWAFVEFGAYVGAGTFVDPRYFALAGLQTNLSAGWGVEVGRVHLRPSARISLAGELTLPDAETGRRFSLTPLALSLAATNLLDEPHTGLRLTPALGLTVPTSALGSVPLTTLSLALQLERRFGPVEVGLRSEVGKPFYVPGPTACAFCPAQPHVNWSWANTLQAEGWISPSFSLGLSLAWNILWGFPASVRGEASVGDSTTGRLFTTWALTKFLGLSFELNTTQPPWMTTSSGASVLRFPFLSFGTWADNNTVLFLSFWFRTDVAIARNWIER